MKLTPLDIRHKEFKRGMRGYVDGEVDEFLDEVADEFERLFKENIELSERVETLQGRSTGTASRRRCRRRWSRRRRSAEELKVNATKEAQLILHEAELKARQMVNDSYADKQAIEQSMVMLKSAEEDFRFKFRALLEGYLKQLDETPDVAEKAASAGPPHAERTSRRGDQGGDRARRARGAGAGRPSAAAVRRGAARRPRRPARLPSAGRTRADGTSAPGLAGRRPDAALAADRAGAGRRASAEQDAHPPRGESDDLLADVEHGVDDERVQVVRPGPLRRHGRRRGSPSGSRRARRAASSPACADGRLRVRVAAPAREGPRQRELVPFARRAAGGAPQDVVRRHRRDGRRKVVRVAASQRTGARALRL